jgi:hypothetical protein
VLAKTPHASAALRLYARRRAANSCTRSCTLLRRSRCPERTTRTRMVLDAHAARGRCPADCAPLRASRRAAARHRHACRRRTRPARRLALHRTRGLRGGAGARRHARLKASNADTERVVDLVARQSDLFPPDAPDAGVRRWLLHVPPGLVKRPVPAAHRALAGEPRITRRRRATSRALAPRASILAQRPPLDTNDLAIDGDDLKALGLPPGPRSANAARAARPRDRGAGPQRAGHAASSWHAP